MIILVEISVVMPVYNTPIGMLKEAVDSILKQTFVNFEFIIIDDASTDGCKEYLDSIKDPRSRIIHNPINLGIAKSLNIGLKAATGKYIARMDSDDISVPERLEKQYIFMESHPDAILCGSNVERFGLMNGIISYNIGDQELYRASLLFFNPGPAHPTAFFSRKKMVDYHILYDEDLKYAQDYEMWTQAIKYGKIYCMDDVLLLYRMHKSQITEKMRNEQKKCGMIIKSKLLMDLFTHYTDNMMKRHERFINTPTLDKESKEWYHILLHENKKRKCYNQKSLESVVYNIVIDKVCNTYHLSKNKPFRYLVLYKYLPFYYASMSIIERIKKHI